MQQTHAIIKTFITESFMQFSSIKMNLLRAPLKSKYLFNMEIIKSCFNCFGTTRYAERVDICIKMCLF